MAEQFFRYVPQHLVEAYRDIGWMVLAHIGQLGGVESVLNRLDGPPVGSASLRPLTGETNLQPRS